MMIIHALLHYFFASRNYIAACFLFNTEAYPIVTSFIDFRNLISLLIGSTLICTFILNSYTSFELGNLIIWQSCFSH